MIQHTPIRITQRQDEYLKELADGPKTTHDIVQTIVVTMGTAGKVLKKLREDGLVESTPFNGVSGNVYTHRLITPYHELNLFITNSPISTPISDEEIIYVAILRNAGMTGQRLYAQYHKLFPTRTYNSIKNMVMRARTRRLCR